MSDLKSYPEGAGANKVRYSGGIEIAFGVVKTLRTRLTIAQINLGNIALLPAITIARWRLLDWWMIAIGGAAGAATSVNISGTVAGSAVQLAAVAIAALTQSAVVRAGAANAGVLADGASFTQMDVNTAILAAKVGAALTTSTHVDFFLDYVADPA